MQSRDMLEPPVRAAGNFPGLLAGRSSWESPFKEARLLLDTLEFDFHLDVAPNALSETTSLVLNWLRALGFEPLDEEECEPELLDDGFTRIYLTPIVPVDDAPLIPATMLPEPRPATTNDEDERGPGFWGAAGALAMSATMSIAVFVAENGVADNIVQMGASA